VLTAYNNETKTAQVIISPTTITVTASGCTVGSKNASVALGTIDMRTLPTVGSTSPSGTFTVGLTCDANGGSRGDDRSDHAVEHLVGGDPDRNSTASGVGVQFFYNGSGPLTMGPDSSAAGTTGQFFIQSTTAAQTLTLPFQAQYIRTGELVPGSANALASITFSYQ
jgi:type 1 fimbria pilin